MIPSEELEWMYLNEGMSIREIAKEIGVGRSTVSNWLREYGIQPRSMLESKLKGKVKPCKKELEQMYIDDMMTITEISDVLGVVSSTISNWLHEYGITVRDKSKSQLKEKIKTNEEELRKMYINELMSINKIGKLVGISHGTVHRWLREYGIPVRCISESLLKEKVKPTRKELKMMYVDKLMSTTKIAGEFGVSSNTVSRCLMEYDILVRSHSDQCGELNPNWQGGISFIPYCNKFNNKFKEAVRERDNYTCQLCGAEQNGRKLSVHHIHYDKKNCYPDCIALCASCNSKVNGNRDYWELFFKDKLHKKGLLNWSVEKKDIK